jgi:cytochrome b involved in lipid metabolism
MSVGSKVSNSSSLTYRAYTSAEVASHNTDSDPWLIIHGRVFSVKTFLEDHPGGPEILLQHAGTDCTKDFEEVFHSAAARKQLEDYVIGTLEGWKEEKKAAAAGGAGKAVGGSSGSGSGSGNGSNEADSMVTYVIYGAGALTLLIAFLYHIFLAPAQQ